MPEEKKKVGRPKKTPVEDSVVDEVEAERLDMTKRDDRVITIDEISRHWQTTFGMLSNAATNGNGEIKTLIDRWNDLNPFLQNQRIKQIYTQAKEYDKNNVGQFLSNPSAHESELRALSWSHSSSQQIYYNILRRSCDIPLYNYFLIPQLLDKESDYNSNDFENEDGLVNNWLETLDVPNTFKTMALEIKREGKSSYLFRNKFQGVGKQRKTQFCTFQKLPTEWVKITGRGQLGFTVSFNMMYFMNISNNPAKFGDFMVEAWNDLVNKDIFIKDEKKNAYVLNIGNAMDYKFEYQGKSYGSYLEGTSKKNFMFWLKMPYDMCFTFGSDNSHPWVAPDTMGLMQKLQELTDYGQLAGLIASTPLTAVLTAEIEHIEGARAGKNESVYAPEILRGWMDQFNAATSTNVEAWLWPAKNVKLQQLSSDVNSSEIISTATENFVETAGEGGLTITDTKPNVMMVKTAQLLSASQQNYVTLQFEQVLNFVLQHKLGLKYEWKVRLWGDIFSNENDRKFLKEVVASGNIALLPKLMSAERISIRDTKAIANYIKSLDFYKEFLTYTQQSKQDMADEASNNEGEMGSGQVGRPELSDEEIESDATAASKEAGTNTADNRV